MEQTPGKPQKTIGVRHLMIDTLPLSIAQERLWFLAQLEPETQVLNFPMVFRAAGQLNKAALEWSLGEIARRHEVLRTQFAVVDGQPVQVICPEVSWDLPLVNLQEVPSQQRQEEVEQLVKEEVQRPFDLTQAPLWRAKLLALSSEEYILVLVLHQGIFDEESQNVFFGELGRFYKAFSISNSPALTELPIQYADFAVWQREWLQSSEFTPHLNYWQQQLGGELPVLDMPTDSQRPPVRTYKGTKQLLTLTKELTEALKELSACSGGNLFVALLTAFKVLLYRYTGQEDVIVGSPVANRNSNEIGDSIGLFSNNLMLRSNLSDAPSFRELLGRTKKVVSEAYAHQEFPFERLVEVLKLERDMSRNPLFQVAFAFRDRHLPTIEFSGLRLSPLPVDIGTAKLDLSLELRETANGVNGWFEYNTDLFDRGRIVRMVGHFQTLLEGAIAEPDKKIWELPILTEAERHQLLVEWNDTATDYPKDKCIHQLFEEQVERTPDNVAVVFEDQQLTYRELNAKANQLAHYLQKLGVGPEVLVGICVERTLEMVVGLLGILKAGGAYVPLDPEYPKERLIFILQDTETSVILTQRHLMEYFSEYGRKKIVCIDGNREVTKEKNYRNPLIQQLSGENLAYVMHTSGSTGVPKGVLISHSSVCNRLLWGEKAFNFTENDKLLQRISINFDGSVDEIFNPLLAGFCLVIPRHGYQNDVSYLIELITKHKITIIGLHPSILPIFLEEKNAEKCCSLRLVSCSGESMSSELRDNFFSKIDAQLCHNYGPTEATITVLTSICERNKNQGIIPLGKPIANTKIYLLDIHSQVVPIGVPGELHISGVCLARGYLNRSQEASEKFIPNPFERESYSRLYRTGDFAQYLPNGNILFLGRIDHQVKLRGFRIELGEIEATLVKHPVVREAVVMLHEFSSNDKRLVAYIVAKYGKLAVSELRYFLKQKLPDYMVPSIFILQEKLPLMPNGKVDHRKLPIPKQERPELFVAPRNELEGKLAKIWEETLGIQRIGVKDNFFELGGHSILAIRLFAEIEKKFGKNLPLATLFQAPTIEKIAQALDYEDLSKSWDSLVPIQPNGSKPPLFCVHAVGGNALFYRQIANYLGPEQPIYGLQSQGLDKKQAPLTKIEDMASLYIKEIQRVQAHGPYLIIGYSFGGLVAFEMARQLCHQNHKVAFVGILDTRSPCFKPSPISLLNSVYIYFRNILASEPEHKLDYILARLRWYLNKLKKQIQKNNDQNHSSRYLDALPDDITKSVLAVSEANQLAGKNYSPSTYSGRITLFRCQLQSPKSYYSWDLGWNELAKGGVEIQHISGEHGTLMKDPHARVLAEHLKHHIDKALTNKEAIPRTATGKIQRLQLKQQKEWSAQWRSLVPIQPLGSKTPLFCIHALGPSVLYYRKLALQLGLERPFYALQAQGLDGQQAPLTKIEDMAAHYIKEIQTIQPEGDYLIGGSSFGGMVALEVAQQLIAQGQTVALLVVFDTIAPGCFTRIPLNQRLSDHFDNFGKLGPNYIFKKIIGRFKWFQHRNKERNQRNSFSLDNIHPNQIVERANKQAARKYIPQVYPGKVALFRAIHKSVPEGWQVDPQMGWSKLATGELEVYEVPGGHTSMFREPHVQVLAEKLRKAISFHGS